MASNSPGGAKKPGKKSLTGKKVTRKDIHKAGDALPALIKQLVKTVAEGNAEAKEQAAVALLQVAQMDHGANSDALFKGGAIKPLVSLLSSGVAKAQSSAAAALALTIAKKAEHQKALVDLGGVYPLVALLRTGSAKV